MRRSLVMILLVLGLVAAACGDDGPARDDSGGITESGDASVFDLKVGDCFDDVTSDVVSEVPVVPCSEPHDNEIYFEFTMTESTFPGNQQAVESGGQRCLEEFEAFVGEAYLDSELDLFPITPTAESWDEGDRTVYCVLYDADLAELTGSMRNSGR